MNLLVITREWTGFSDTRPLFPGSTTFYSIFDQIGMTLVKTSFLPIDHPSFDDFLTASGATVALTLGPEALHRLTGITKPITKIRGYLLQPSDCQPISRRVRAQIGVYKTTKKGVYTKGDPRFGMITTASLPVLPPNLQWIIPTYDPLVVQMEKLEPTPILKADMLRTKDLLSGNCQLCEPIILSDPPNSTDAITLDIETIGFTGSIERIGLATNQGGWTAPWTEPAQAITRDLVRSAKIIQGHNLAFDLPRLAAEGIEVTPSQARFDTMLAATLLNPRVPKTLEYIAPLHLNVRPWKHLSTSNATLYNVSDVFHTHQVASDQKALLLHTGQFKLFTTIIMPATPVLIEMTKLGIKVDRERLSEWQALLSQELQDTAEEWYGYVQDINPFSSKQLAYYLYTELGMAARYAKRGKNKTTLTTDEEALRALMDLYPENVPLLDCLLRLKKLDKAFNTYAKVELSYDGCVHPSYLPQNKYSDNGTAATGRIASTNPNIQNQTPDAKKLYIPHFPNWYFIEFDFSQIELRIAAALSGDNALQKALGDAKGDVHAHTMEHVGCDRVRAKNLIYGSLYGAGPAKLSRILRSKGIPTTTEECQELQNALSRAYPRLWAWRSLIALEGTARRSLTNPFGRKRYFFDREAIPEMYDYIPQSTAADILWSLLPSLNNFAKDNGGHFLTTTHDSGLFEFPSESITPKLHQSLRDVCERRWPEIAPDFFVPIKLKTGTSWGTLSDIHP